MIVNNIESNYSCRRTANKNSNGTDSINFYQKQNTDCFINKNQPNINFGSRNFLKPLLKIFKIDLNSVEGVLAKNIEKTKKDIQPLKKGFIITGSGSHEPAKTGGSLTQADKAYKDLLNGATGREKDIIKRTADVDSNGHLKNPQQVKDAVADDDKATTTTKNNASKLNHPDDNDFNEDSDQTMFGGEHGNSTSVTNLNDDIPEINIPDIPEINIPDIPDASEHLDGSLDGLWDIFS